MAASELRNFYRDSPHGQLHVHGARPADGGTPTKPALFCFHQGPQSGKVFIEMLKRLGTDRMVYAPDYPGCGNSSPAAEEFSLEDLAQIMIDMISDLGHAPIDILGYHTGSTIATELALRIPQTVRRIVMVGLPVLDADFNIDVLYRTADGEPIPAPVSADGKHFMTEWNRSAKWFAGAPVEVVQRSVIDKLIAGKYQTWSSRAALLYPLRDKLPLVEHPIMAIGPRDDLWEISPRAEALIKNGSFRRWPDHGFGVFDIAPEEMGSLIRGHLDG